MKKLMMTVAAMAMLPASAALAGEDDCKVPQADRASWAAVMQLAEDYGWTIDRMEVDDGCYKLRVKDIGGNVIKADVDPGTLQVLKARIRFSEGSPAVSATPAVATPAN